MKTFTSITPQAYDPDSTALTGRRFAELTKNFYKSTPGKYLIFGVGCIIVVLISTIGNYINLQSKSSAYEYIRTRQEPLREATMHLDMDVKTLQNSLNRYVLDPHHPEIFLFAYQKRIQMLTASLTTASTNDSMNVITYQLNQLSPEITRLISLGDLASQNVLTNYPLAVAQLDAFNMYCDSNVKPLVGDLASKQNNYLAKTLRTSSSPSYESLTLSFFAIISLLLLLSWFSVKTKRLLNPGILFSITILIVSIIWFCISNLTSSRDVTYINNRIYHRLSNLNAINSNIQNIQYLQYQFLHLNLIRDETEVTLKKEITQTHDRLDVLKSLDTENNQFTDFISSIEQYLNASSILIATHSDSREIILFSQINFTQALPDAILENSENQTKTIESKIVSQISKAKSRYNYISPFYYLVNIAAIGGISCALYMRIREYR